MTIESSVSNTCTKMPCELVKHGKALDAKKKLWNHRDSHVIFSNAPSTFKLSRPKLVRTARSQETQILSSSGPKKSHVSSVSQTHSRGSRLLQRPHCCATSLSLTTNRLAHGHFPRLPVFFWEFEPVDRLHDLVYRIIKQLTQIYLTSRRPFGDEAEMHGPKLCSHVSSSLIRRLSQCFKRP